MTDEELKIALTEVKSEIDQFGSEKQVSNQDWRRKMRLVEQFQVLEKIQKAQSKSDLSREAHLTAYYHLLAHEQSMNPFLNYLLKIRLRSIIWM